MDIREAIEARHSVRRYSDRPIDAAVVETLREEIERCNAESGLDMRLVTDDFAAFDSRLARYGKFSGVRNYIALIGPKKADTDEKCGYYGERVALLAVTLGLNFCWVGLTFSKKTVKRHTDIAAGSKLECVIALGYGETQGVAHRSKQMDALCEVSGAMPEWFKNGMEAVMLAPTAMNQQHFKIALRGDKAQARSTGGFFSKVDLGIVKYHFEIGSGRGRDVWAR